MSHNSDHRRENRQTALEAANAHQIECKMNRNYDYI